MNNSAIEKILKERDYSFKKPLFKVINEFSLTLNEVLLLIYFLNQDKPLLDIDNISSVIHINGKDILESFTNLNSKGLLAVDMKKNTDGKLNEVINLNNLYKAMVADININIKNENKEDIFLLFEKEFGRTLSPMEFEIISAWIKSGINEEIIIGALKEATYNGVSNLRYIDKILYEWGKKGFKNMNDVTNYITKKNNSKKDEKKEELFDYNWLEDEE